MPQGYGLPPPGCELKLNDCVCAGTGPSCCSDSTATNTCGEQKKNCEDQIKKSCDDKLQKCIEDCKKDKVKQYEDMVKEEQRQEEEKKKKAADENAECWKAIQSSSRYKDNMKVYEQAVKDTGNYADQCAAAASSHGQLRRRTYTGDPAQPFLRWERFPDPTVTPINNLSRMIIRTKMYRGFNDFTQITPEDYDVAAYLEKIFGDEVCTTYKFSHMMMQHYQDEAKGGKDACKKKVPDKKKNKESPCDEARIKEVNIKIGKCWVDCYQSVNNNGCAKAQCSCDSFSCPGPDIHRGGEGGGGGTPDTTKPDDFKVQDATLTITLSAYGIPLELVYTRAFLPGNVLWIGDVTEEREVLTSQVYDEELHKHVPKRQLIINNFISMDVGLCAGEIETISRVWLDEQLVYDKTTEGTLPLDNQTRLNLDFRSGSEAQKVSPAQAAREGWGRTPAYRGLATISFNDINLSAFKQFPAFNVEVVKRIDTDDLFIEATTITGGVDIVKVDPDARRIFATTATAIKTYDYDTFALVTSKNIADVIHVTPLPAFLTLETNDLVLYDAYTEDERVRVTPSITVDQTFLFRDSDFNNHGSELLLAMNTGGEFYFYTVDDVQGVIELYTQFDNVFTTGPGAVAQLEYTRPEGLSTLDHIYNSVFAFKVSSADILVAEFVSHSTDLAAPLLQDAAKNDLTIEDAFGGATTGVLHGAVASEFQRGIVVLFGSYDSGANKVIIGWHPYAGVQWTTEVDELPSNLKVRRNHNKYLYFINDDNTMSRLDVTTGTVVEVEMGSLPTIAGSQYLDTQTVYLTYWQSGDAITRALSDRVVPVQEPISVAFADVCERAGLTAAQYDVSGIADVVLPGFRSGALETGRQILDDLMELFAITVYEDDKIVFIKKSVGTTRVIPSTDLGEPFGYERLFEAYQTRSAQVSYYSDELDGKQAKQRFSLPDDPYQGRITYDRQFTVLASDDYMRSLAELFVFALQEKDAEAEITLSSKHLALTPTDIALLTQGYRVDEMLIGADHTIKLKLSLDAAAKYNNFADIGGVAGFGTVDFVEDVGTLAAPIAFASRAVGANELNSADVFYGASNVVDEFQSDTTLSISTDENPDSSVGGNPHIMTEPMTWGYLVTPPPPTTAPFTTQQASFTVKFQGNFNYAGQLATGLPQEVFYTTNVLNTIVVGNEIIQVLNYTVDEMDPTLVTFDTLGRARWSTEMFMDHNVGDLCYILDFDRVDNVRVRIEDRLDPVKVKTTRGRQARRMDVVAPAVLFKALPAHATTRWDWTPSGPSFQSTLHPANNHVFIQTQQRFQNMRDLSLTMEEQTFNEYDYHVYLLRDSYDEATFLAALDPYSSGDYSYIIFDADAVLQAFTGAAFDINVNEEYYGVLWTAGEHDTPDWDAATEKLTAVIVMPDPELSDYEQMIMDYTMDGDVGVTRSWATWTPGEYVKRRQRGTY